MYQLMSVVVLMVSVVKFTHSTRPNFLIILTDDQDVTLSGLTPLNKTRKLIGEEGSLFTNAFVTTPVCCPSRSSILTGLYQHSHGTVNNSLAGNCSSKRWQESHEPHTFAAQLHRAGYRTFYGGKYLNKYGYKSSGGVEHVPHGWDWWIGLVGNSVYYNYTLSVNGSRVDKGDKESDYLTDVLKEYSLSFLTEQAPDEPFLMMVSTPAPHEPFTPARRHEGKFSGFEAPRTPNFNVPVNDRKHWLLRLLPDKLPPETVDRIDQVFRNRWETLLAVDDLVEELVKRLENLRLLNNTYIIFISDNGFHLGQFGQPWDKRQPYETDVRVPLMVRGPGVLKGVVKHPVLNIDIAPTILTAAKVSSQRVMDGMSFLPLMRSETSDQQDLSRTFLLEYHGESGNKKNPCYNDPNVKLCELEAACKCFDARNNTFMCVRHLSDSGNDVFCQFGDDESFEEYYDLQIDPYQMKNLFDGSKADIRRLVLHCCKRQIQKRKSIEECYDRRGLLPVPEIIQLQ
ncbi:hypothetical protein RUM44_000626 [Polyplax serrata]|uniref:Sulfatase N-terminal domain-containing protein n=1 Tax=Polyplax serrata TaxID=468196 RepID=A0ABR1B5Y6_POLSC